MAGWYFAWVEADETFDPDIHARRDEDVASIDVYKSAEGDFATADVVIANPGITGLLAASRKGWAIISHQHAGEAEPVALFRGRITDFPSDGAEDWVTLTLVAEPVDYEATLADANAALAVQPYFDPLFVDDLAGDLTPYIAEGYGAVHDWHPVNHDVQLVDEIDGDGTSHIDLGTPVGDFDGHFRGIRFGLREPPLSSVDVVLTAEWEQRSTGRCDIGPAIRAAHPNIWYAFSTYAPDQMESALPRSGQSIGADSGWTVEFADIKRASGYDLITTGRRTYGDEVYGPTDAILRLRRYRFDVGQVLARWDYSQSRRDVARFSVSQSIQGSGRKETIELNLQDPTVDRLTPLWIPDTEYAEGDTVIYGGRCYECQTDHTSPNQFGEDGYIDPSWVTLWQIKPSDQSALGRSDRDDLLGTERGRQIIEHAILVARSKMRDSLRRVEISFSAPMAMMRGVSTRHTVRLVDPKLPAGEATGKVSSFTIHGDFQGGEWVDCTILCSIGLGDAGAVASDGVGAWAEDGIVDGGIQQMTGGEHSAVGGIVYSVDSPTPVRRVYVPNLGNHAYSVVKSEMRNGPDVQQMAAKSVLFSHVGSLELMASAISEAIGRNPTTLEIQMRSLAAEDTIERNVTVTVANLATPIGINLEAEA